MHVQRTLNLHPPELLHTHLRTEDPGLAHRRLCLPSRHKTTHQRPKDALCCAHPLRRENDRVRERIGRIAATLLKNLVSSWETWQNEKSSAVTPSSAREWRNFNSLIDEPKSAGNARITSTDVTSGHTSANPDCW
ncbi:unnamed protein product [Peniophora sp. CBMAI 1063]|nr:unnamed protein product [Peniophora sp. CBMAI 1063]